MYPGEKCWTVQFGRRGINAQELYSGGSGLESQPGGYPVWNFPWVSLVAGTN
jgi:hypothetical protein